MNYYKQQLERIKNSEYSKTIKISDRTGNTTNTVDLNEESIPVLIQWLTKELSRLANKEVCEKLELLLRRIESKQYAQLLDETEINTVKCLLNKVKGE